MSAWLFVVLAGVALGSALTVVLHRSPVYSALALVITLFDLAIFFAALEAHLVAGLQVVVYAGAIVVLFLFVVNLLNLQAEPRRMAGAGTVGMAGLGAIALATLTVRAVTTGPASFIEVPAGFGTTAVLGARLFTAHLVPFELTSLLLLVAIVGAVVVAKRRSS